MAAGNRGDDEEKEGDEKDKKKKQKKQPKFIPHIIRLTKLINDKVHLVVIMSITWTHGHKMFEYEFRFYSLKSSN